MKRSKMILFIAECLVDPHFECALEEAAYILRRLENKGMLPPAQEILDAVSQETSALYTYDCYCGGNYNSIDIEDFCKWEPEDELP